MTLVSGGVMFVVGFLMMKHSKALLNSFYNEVIKDKFKK